MSFGKRTDGNVIYFRVAGGKLVRSAKQDTPGAVPVQTPKGDTVYQLHDDFIEGTIVSFDENSVEFNGRTVRSLVVVMKDMNEVYKINMTRGKQYWSDFLMRLPMVDLDEPVKLTPYDITGDDDKRSQGVSIKQRGVKIPRAFTKDNPGNLPQPVEKEFNGEMKLDWGARDKYLEEVVLAEAKQRLQTPTNDDGAPPPVDAEDTEDPPY